MSERRGTKALELWCRRVTEGYSGVKIENMTTSWRDGLAFCAMIHHFKPDLIDFDKLNKSDVYYNNALAFTTAEKYLGIPSLLDADDMAAYEVPDRLSILTYLSQFYQVFASQEIQNGLKRSSSSHTDKTKVTKSSGPPTKMALMVGVPKRDPCRKCQMPVFLAERLVVGEKVYHRTCLKCARCGHQLTPGSFYETETDEQYCCETCPDEEVNLKSAGKLSLDNEISVSFCSNPEPINRTDCESSVIQSPPLKAVRSSIKERLAFFENNGIDGEPTTKLLQKSLSDEEKSKSLQRSENSSGTVEFLCRFDKNATNLFSNAVADEDSFTESSSIKNSKIEIFDSGSDTNNLTHVSLPPELPKSLPPLKKLNHNKNSEEKSRFSVSAQLVLGSLPHAPTFEKLDQEQNILNLSTTKNQDTELQRNFSASIIDNTNDKEHQTGEKTLQLHPNCIEINLEFSDSNDNDCITKEKFPKNTKTKDLNNETNTKHTNKTNNQLNTNRDEVQPAKKIKPFEEDLIELRTNTNDQNQNDPLQLNDNNTIKGITNNAKAEISTKQSPVNDFENEIMLNEEIIASKLSKNESFRAETNDKKPLYNDIEIELKTENLKISNIIEKVPLKTKTNEYDLLLNNLDDKKKYFENNNSDENENFIQTPGKNNSKTSIEKYPDDLNPFKSDDEEILENNNENEKLRATFTISEKTKNLNPFDSSDDEVELEKSKISRNAISSSTHKIPPPRPPPPRILKNPFGSGDEDIISIPNLTRRSSLSGSQNRKTPLPTPRLSMSLRSQNTTPEPTSRLGTELNTASFSVSITPNNTTLPILRNFSEFYGSTNSLYSSNTAPFNLLRNSDIRSSNNSLNLSMGGTIRSRKTRRAPLPPAPVKELFPSNETIASSSKTSTPCSSIVGTPKSSRKKRPAPAPPKPARLEASTALKTHGEAINSQSKNLINCPLQSELDSKLSDEEKALLEGKTSQSLHSIETLSPSSRRSSKRLIPLDQDLLEEHGLLQYTEETHSQCDDSKQQDQQKSLEVCEKERSVVYRRVLVPQNLETPIHEHNPLEILSASSLGERQLEKLKDNKEANNRNRQSHISVSSSGADDNDSVFNKSAHGKWKRRKGPAPALPVPARKVLQMLPLQEIKHEMEIIEVQQQGLEKQGVILEKMIRDRCERENGEPLNVDEPGDTASGSSTVENSKEVENLILQLFELVNEKNELFRRQAELMYLRRQHRLEQEQADLEYEIRNLMAQPERNKTDSDKAREEALIERLVEVVQLRNEVVECLEMDRLREAEEDQSIKQRLESHMAKRGDNINNRRTLTKLSKKEKKKQKEAKKLFKSKKLDADKDADESESNVDKQKFKKRKKLLIF